MAPPADVEVSTLRRKRGSIKASITNLKHIITAYRETPVASRNPHRLQAALDTVKERFKGFDDIQCELEALDEAVDRSERFEIENSFYEAVGDATALLEESSRFQSEGTLSDVTTVRGSTENGTTSAAAAKIKLPKIDPPKFDGNFENWPSFIDSFSYMIDKNEDIPAVQKLHFLRTGLSGRAAAAIQSLPTTSESYTTALEILRKKFDCKRKIIDRHWTLLQEFPRLRQDSAKALGELVDAVRQHTRALTNLGQLVDHWHPPLIHLIRSKISEDTIWHWELTLKDSDYPTYTGLLDYLEKRAACSEQYVPNSRTDSVKIGSSLLQRKNKMSQSRQAFVTNESNQETCPICNETHTIMKCQRFKAMNPFERFAEVKKASLCINCLKSGHTLSTCTSRDCSICKGRHNTLLHKPRKENEAIAVVTATVNIINKKNEPIKCRALLDTGSTTNFITEDLANSLHLPRKPFAVPIGALNSMETKTKYLVTATIKSRNAGYEKTLNFLTVPSIAQQIPDKPLDRKAIKLPKALNLADPEFDRPAPVDLLLGSGTTLSLLCEGQIHLTPSNQLELYLQKTVLGWVIGGCAPTVQPVRQRTCNVLASDNMDLARFWEIEEPQYVRQFSNEEAACEEHFKKNVHRNETGRYIVALPFNDNQVKLGESRSRAFNRLRSLERRLQGDQDLNKQYRSVIQEYLDLGHMTEVHPSSLHQKGFYLPHHAVIKECSLTTKVRVVFDGSAKTNTGISLNDALRIGPTLQEDIFTLLLRFRWHQFVLTGDIEKMYRQVLIRPEDRKYQRILWRNCPTEAVRTYQLNTVTFGLSAAPYLAIRCLHQLADDEGHRYPTAAKILKRDLYVDDLLTGTQTREEALKLREELKDLVERGGFNLRQWASNDPTLLDGLPKDCMSRQLQLGGSTTLKTLGIFWNSTTDSITYSGKSTAELTRLTKRIILSEIAKIFDPLGLLGPIVIIAKILMQRLWTLKLDWDSPLPTNIREEWTQFHSQLPLLKDVQFPRRVIVEDAHEIELHGFCDASQAAYGACIYVRSTNIDGHVEVQLFCAKSRVAPLKQITIPRLELCGAQLLTSLVETCRTAIQSNIKRIIYWTDSTVVLHWLHTPPARLQTFVSNRISDIQTKTNIEDWRHVRSLDNPADLISRGQAVEEFVKTTIWKQGPSWLRESENKWPCLDLQFSTSPLETKREYCHAVGQRQGSPLDWYSSIYKLQRIIAICLRLKSRRRGPFTVQELRRALNGIIHWLQAEVFSTLITALTDQTPRTMKNSKLAKFGKLSPFIDKNGLIRVGGRLRNAQLPFSQRHPILLPKKHHVTLMIVQNAHVMQLHAGSQTTLYALRQKYWVLDGRNVVRHITRNCVKCVRMKPPPVEYIMGNLPAARVTKSRPFCNVGIDFCGPFHIKEKRFRNRGSVKIYVAVFICLSVKAVHLEVVSDLTTEAFLAALRRFIARRGFCENIYSDNGTNFVGANNEMKDITEFLRSQKSRKDVDAFLLEKSITWHFTPPQSPHFGGLWEAAVKSFKHHLYRIMPNELLTFEGFNTLVIEIEAVLNSRPLTPLSSDASDLLALTPGHFLIGDVLTSIAEPDFEETPSNRLSTWQHIQKLKQQFWTRWHRDYISELNQRTKWIKGEHHIKEGTMVLLKEDHLPARQWALGRVVKIHPGTDGIIRVVTVKTAKGTFQRNVKKLAPLPVDDDERLR